MADDFSANTATTGTLTPGDYTRARIDMAGDQDWFRVTLDAGTTYRIDVEGRWGAGFGHHDVHLGGVYDSSGTLIPGTTNYNSGTFEDARGFFTPATSGTYYVSAGIAPAVDVAYDTDYRVRITDNWDDYAGDTTTTGALSRLYFSNRYPFSDGGNSDWQGDRDWFAVELAAGQEYTVVVNGNGEWRGSSVGWVIPDGYLYGVHDASGTYLAGTRDDNSGPGEGALTNFTAPTAGTYYISAGLSPTGDGEGGYQIALYEDDYAQDTGTGGRLTVGGSVSGNFFYQNDRDWFAVDLEAGEDYAFVLEADGYFSPRIHSIRDETGQRFANTSDRADQWRGEAITHFTAPTDGTYYVDVEAYYKWFGPQSYSLSAIANELADDTGTEGRIAVGGHLRGSIDFAGDSDWIAVDFTAGETYRVTMSSGGSDGTVANPLIYSIRDDNGVHIPGTSNMGGTLGTAEVWFTATETATHYIDARAGRDSGSTYMMRVARIEDDFGSDPAGAGMLAVGGQATGVIDTPTDTDWFASELEAGETYRVRVLGSDSGDGTLPRPLLAGIFEPDGDLVPFSVQAGTGAGFNTEWLYTATESGTFHFAAGGHLNHRGSYTMELNQLLTLRGTEGDDWLTIPDGADLQAVRGETGRDMLSFVNLPAPGGQGVAVDLDTDMATLFGAGSRINLYSIEDVTGSLHDDMFRGSDRAEIFRGLGGDDLFYGSDGGVDVYDGGTGRDTLSYALSDAGVSVSLLRGTGWAGDARGDSLSGIENIIGTLHDDFIWGDLGDNRLEGSLGDDTIVGNGGDDYILAGLGTDTIVFSGNRAEYEVVQDGIRTEVTHLAGGLDGTDVIGHAEVLRFADGDLIL